MNSKLSFDIVTYLVSTQTCRLLKRTRIQKIFISEYFCKN